LSFYTPEEKTQNVFPEKLKNTQDVFPEIDMKPTLSFQHTRASEPSSLSGTEQEKKLILNPTDLFKQPNCLSVEHSS